MLPVAAVIGRSWAQRGGRCWEDEYVACATAALGEAAVTWDPERASFRHWARFLMGRRCNDLRRHVFVNRRGELVFSNPVDIDLTGAEAPPLAEPGDDQAVRVRALLAEAMASAPERRARGGTVPARRTFAAALAWVGGEPQTAIAARLGVHPSRVAQLVAETAAYLREAV